MYNNDKRNVRYEDEYEDIENEMMSERTAFARSKSEDRENTRPKRDFVDTADYEKLINEATERCIEDDLVPSVTTMQFATDDRVRIYQEMNDCRDDGERTVAKEGLSGKNKVMIAVYAIVVLTIFTLIVMNTRLLKTMDSNISEQEAQISELVLENAELSERYSLVSSDEEVVRRAEELGMVSRE